MTDVQIYRPIGEGGQLSGFDERLLEMGRRRMTGEEMYEELGSPEGLSPERCLQRVREIIKAQDYLSISEQKAFILLDFIRLRDILFDRIEGSDLKVTKHGDVIEVGSAPAWANALVRTLKEWRTTIDSMQLTVESETMMIRRGQAKIMMEAIIPMFEMFVTRLQANGVKVTKKMAREIMEDVIPLGFQALERRIAE